MGPFFYGDSYGGVQQAAQAAENSDRQMLQALWAAQQRGQELAFQQSQADRNAALAAQEMDLRRAQLVENMRQWNQNFGEQQRQANDRTDLLWANTDLRQAALDQREAEFNKRLKLVSDKANYEGPALANSFANTLATRNSTFQSFQEAQANLAAINAEGERSRAQGLVSYDKAKGWVPAVDKLQDKASINLATDLNKRIQEAALAIQQAQETAKRADSDFSRAAKLAQVRGFVPDMVNGSLLHPGTGQAFSFLQTQQAQADQQPRLFDWKTGKLAKP